MEAELEKDLEDDVIPVPSETDDLDDDDPELNALTKIAERNSTQVFDFFLLISTKFHQKIILYYSKALKARIYLLLPPPKHKLKIKHRK